MVNMIAWEEIIKALEPLGLSVQSIEANQDVYRYPQVVFTIRAVETFKAEKKRNGLIGSPKNQE